MTSQVTIGIPFFNAARTLADAIRSVFAQRFDDWTLMLVDDGSTDRSLEIAHSIRDSRVVVLSDGMNRGLIWRLNEIARRCKSPLLARMDADDLMHPDRLALQVAHFRAHPDTDMLGTAAYTIDGSGEPVGIRGDGPLPTSIRDVLRRSPFIHPTIMFRAAFARENPYEPAYPRAEDLALWCRICETARCGLIRDPLLYYREPVPINLRNYVFSSRTVRQLLRDLGADVLPSQERYALLLKSHISDMAYRVTARLGGQGWLVHRRSRALSSSERVTARAILSQIGATKLPGVADSDDLELSQRLSASLASGPTR